MSEVIKVGYRGLGGFIAITLAFAFGVSSFAFFVVGAVAIALGVVIVINPQILQDIPVQMFSTRVLDPTVAFIALFVVGMVVIVLGVLFLSLTSAILKASVLADKRLSIFVDKNVPRTGEVIDKVKTKTARHEQEPTDKLSKLERLAKLKENGTLTEEEFLQEKRLILKEKDN